MDKALAAFNIALGAIALGMKVEIFFTFWGLSIIKKKANSKHKESYEAKLMGDIMPNDDNGLPLSRDNMLGLGKKMMERIMKEKNVPSVDFMMHLSKFDGVKFIACNMSMDILGITIDELIDGAQIGGVATMLEFARKSSVNYFI